MTEVSQTTPHSTTWAKEISISGWQNVVNNTIFRIQAKIQGFNNISCSTPSFSGQICYPPIPENASPPPPTPPPKPRCDEACGLIIAGALGCVSTIIAAILGFYKGSHDKP
ncbi:2156_t:CDS:2 [Funneliformis caledonium]|uniref:2156_t:CDS:1 n=1 Tax=Funneliformis caledonium TaxID=1117310 RepID=A0A9N9CQC3_9GLOM|nr:2156_t:CDS:2 [Funneliformis caledonium]